MRRLWLLLVTIAILNLVGCAPAPLDMPSYLALVTPSLPGLSGQCTGAIVAPRKVVTARHCVETGRRVVTMTGQEALVTEARVSNLHDVAVLTVDRTLWVSEYAEFGQPQLGVQATLMGFCPYMVSHVVRHGFYGGLVNALMQDGNEYDLGVWQMVGSQICGGDSGLPIVQNGKVVGVLSAVETNIPWFAIGDVAYSVPVEYAVALLEME